MEKQPKDLRKQLHQYQFDFDLLQRIDCSYQENNEFQKILDEGGTLPEGVFSYKDDENTEATFGFYRIYQTDLTEEEMQQYLTYKKLSLLRTIKNCAMFFTGLTIVSIVLTLIYILSWTA